MVKGNQTVLNLICSLAVLLTNICISFFLSPFIVEHIGVEANGFVTLANNFVMYANLIVMALNSMSARFITVEYIKKNYKKAEIYYNSVFWGKLLIVVFLIVPAISLIVALQNIFDVPPEIRMDVKILFSLIFLNFLGTTALPNWDCAVYLTNRLDRQYIPNMITSVFRCIFLFGVMTIFTPRVWYVGFSATLVTLVTILVNYYNKRCFVPELNIYLKKEEIVFSKEAMKELLSSGIWNSISSVGNILLTGLDLVICNITLGATAMGVISLSKTLPNYVQQFSMSIRNAFAPELTINYAKGDKEAVLRDINRAMKITSVILTIPIACIVILGDAFFSLWVPSQDAQILQMLSILAIVGYMFTSGTQILYNVFTTVNKVKINAIAMLISGAVSTIVTLIFVNYTNWGLYAVAGVSTVINLIRNLTFTIPMTARYLGYKWYKFYPQVITTVVTSIVLIICGCIIKPVLYSDNWIAFMLSGGCYATVCLLINVLVLLNKEDRRILFRKVMRRKS